jgi:hypothetical protein
VAVGVGGTGAAEAVSEPMDISIWLSSLGCEFPGVERTLGLADPKATGLEETGFRGIEPVVDDLGGIGRESLVVLKKGRVLFPQPGMLTTHPDEISNKTKSIAEKMERLLKVSRNRMTLVIT